MCIEPRANNKFVVSEHLFVKIWLTDTTYLQFLRLVKVVFLGTSPERVQDYTQLSKIVGGQEGSDLSASKNGEIIVDIELMEPSQGAMIQVQLQIVGPDGVRRLVKNDQRSKVSENF